MRYRVIIEVEAHPQMTRKQFNDQIRRILDCGRMHKEFGNVVYVATDIAADNVITHDGKIVTIEPAT